VIRRAALGILLAACVAVPSTAAARDYGRWQVTVSGHLQDRWESSASTACAITGNGAADLSFASSRPLTVHLRRITTRGPHRTHLWRVASLSVIQLSVSGTVSADAVRQPPPTPDDTCAWPDPATWSCGPLEYPARQELLGATSGLGLADTHYFDFPPRAHEPDGHECGLGQAGSGADLPVMRPAHGSAYPLFRLRPAKVARRRRIVIREHADGSSVNSYDERPPFEASDSRQRDATLVLTPVR
jgi:hypothetical protein